MKRLLLLCLLFPALGFAQDTDPYRLDIPRIRAFAQQDSCYMALWWNVLKGLEEPSQENMRKLYYGFAMRAGYKGDKAFFDITFPNDLIKKQLSREKD